MVVVWVVNVNSTMMKRLNLHPLWTLNSEGQLVRRFVAKNFKVAMEFLNKAAEVAESMGHHPDFHLTSYRNVEVSSLIIFIFCVTTSLNFTGCVVHSFSEWHH